MKEGSYRKLQYKKVILCPGFPNKFTALEIKINR